jgi:hypothetical protein
MRLLTPAVLLAFLVLVKPGLAAAAKSDESFSGKLPLAILQSNINATALPPGQRPQQNGSAAAAAPENATITIPAGTKVTLALTSPIWAKTAKGGDAVYATTAFPLVSHNTMAIPAGTYVQGQIDSVTKPGWRTPRAQLLLHFSKIIFASGYTLELESAPAQAATATVHVEVTSRNDVLLDNGAQFDMVVQTPLKLDANMVAQAVRQSRTLTVAPARSASLCRPIPATPGTPDTVIPGTPGSPGTPDTVISGPNGTTTVIPGIPATQGTPPTILPGTPGTPAIPCPSPPAVVSGPSGVQVHRHAFQVKDQLTISGTKLSPGNYELIWIGTDTKVQVDVQRSGKTIVRASARIAALSEKSSTDKTLARTNLDGSTSLASLEFAGEDFAVILD